MPMSRVLATERHDHRSRARRHARSVRPEFRAVFFKTLGLTLLALVALWFGLKELFDWLALPWIDALLPGLPSWAGWLGSSRRSSPAWPGDRGGAADRAGHGDDRRALPRRCAEAVERTAYPADPLGRRCRPAGRSCNREILRRRHPGQSDRARPAHRPWGQHCRFLRGQRLPARPRVLRIRGDAPLPSETRALRRSHPSPCFSLAC